MIQIMSASELAKISEEGKQQFEKDALESPVFRSLVTGIEEAALKGYTGYYGKLNSNHDRRAYEIYVKYLCASGYKAEIKRTQKKGLLGFYFEEEFHVSWKQATNKQN